MIKPRPMVTCKPTWPLINHCSRGKIRTWTRTRSLLRLASPLFTDMPSGMGAHPCWAIASLRAFVALTTRGGLGETRGARVQPGAGTDANVSIILRGDKGDSGLRALSKGAHDFERGSSDTFDVESEDLGTIHEVSIGHDNHGLGPSWHLEQVRQTPLRRTERQASPGRTKNSTKRASKVGNQDVFSDFFGVLLGL